MAALSHLTDLDTARYELWGAFRTINGNAVHPELMQVAFASWAEILGGVDTLADVVAKSRAVNLIQYPPRTSCTAEQDDAANRLRFTFKALAFIIRAHQDILARLIVDACGQKWGHKTTMPLALKKAGPAHEVLHERLPQYVKWFPTWRGLRNDAKEGVIVHLTGTPDDPGIVLGKVRYPPDDQAYVGFSKTIRLSDVVQAVRMTARATAILPDLHKERGTVK